MLVEFVRRWRRGDTLESIAGFFDVSKRRVASKASRLRQKGVPLESRPRGRTPGVDYDALAKIAKGGQE